MNKQDFQTLYQVWRGTIADRQRYRVQLTGDQNGTVAVTGDKTMMWVRNPDGSIERIRRGTISINTPAGTPIYSGAVEGINSPFGQAIAVAPEQISGWSGASYQAAWVANTAGAIGYADAEFNLTGSENLTYSGTRITIQNDSVGAQILLKLCSATLGNNPFIFGQSAGGTLALPTQTLAGKNLLRISGAPHDGAAFAAASRARMDLRASEDCTPTAQGSEIVFLTTEKTTTTTREAAKVADDGLMRMMRGGAINRVHSAGSITIPANYSMVISEYYEVQAGANLTVEAGADVRIF
jgi:hypothetical protein